MDTNETIHYLVSMPPHSPSDEMNKIACALSTTVAEAGLMIRFPSNAIWRQAKRPQQLRIIQEELTPLGIHTTVLSAEDIFSLPAPEAVSSITVNESSFAFSFLTGGNCTIDFNKPFVCIQQQPKAFGSEYRRFREKERAKKDKRKRQALNENLAVFADGPNEILKGTGEGGKYDMRITLTQRKANEEICRVEIRPASISYEFLAEKMAANLAENVTRFLQLMSDVAEECVIKTGLLDIPVRYPMVLNPSFIQQIEAHGYEKDAFTPSILMERLATLTALTA